MKKALTPEELLRGHLRELGRIGGRVSSPAKRAAAKENAKKAIAARWGKVKPDGR